MKLSWQVVLITFYQIFTMTLKSNPVIAPTKRYIIGFLEKWNVIINKRKSKIKPWKSCLKIIKSNNNFIPTEQIKATEAGLNKYSIDFTYLLFESFLNKLKTIQEMTIIGKTKAKVDIIAPKSPSVINPAKVDIFNPTGPGVIADIAIKLVNCSDENQL